MGCINFRQSLGMKNKKAVKLMRQEINIQKIVWEEISKQCKYKNSFKKMCWYGISFIFCFTSIDIVSIKESDLSYDDAAAALMLGIYLPLWIISKFFIFSDPYTKQTFIKYGQGKLTPYSLDLWTGLTTNKLSVN